MRLSAHGCSSMLAAAVAVTMLACRAPSGGAQHDPAAAGREADAATPAEPTMRASDHPAGADAAVEPAPDSAAAAEPPAAAAVEPSEAALVPEPEPAAEPEPAKACRRPGPQYTGPLRDLVGLDEAAVRRCLGDPARTSGSTWHYQWPQGCAYEVSRVVVRFARGKVASAQAKHEITGRHCGAEL